MISREKLRAFALAVIASGLVGSVAAEESPPPLTMGALLEASAPEDWRPLDQGNTLYLTLERGRVVMELAPAFAPRHVANIKALVAERFFDRAKITRSQENYVVQWGDPAQEGEARLPIRKAKASLPAELERAASEELPVVVLDDPDAYAPEVGFAAGLPVAVDPEAERIWLTHCYGMVGVGRDVAPDSGSGAEMYVVIGHSPRHLDRNVTLVGRVVEGMEHLSTLPRGTGSLGFYEDPKDYVPITSVRLGSEMPEAERAHLELLRTDSETFRSLIAARRTRTESWFVESTGRIGLCNVPLPIRAIASRPSD
jgi:peptidylprolyl isomerase